MKRRTLLSALPALSSPWLATAQGNKPQTWIVPFPAGGGTDAFARPLTALLTKQMGRQVLIDNKGGAGGTVGAGVAAKLAPDGSNFFMGAVHHAIAPAMYPRLDYRLEEDFIPVGLLASVPQVIVVHPGQVPVGDLKGLLATLRAKPGKLNYGSAGNGTSHHLAGELFKLNTKTFITHIPYRGAGPALQDLIAGNVDMMFDGLGSSAAHIKGGRIKALMVAGAKRNPAFPDVPCAGELGLPDYTVQTWYGIWAPKGTPADLAAAMQAELRKAFATEEIRNIWHGLGAETPNLYGDAFGQFVSAEVRRWANVVKTSGAKME
jgi:tripartite-type tricarboxylate transporter receptor subunit TctC